MLKRVIYASELTRRSGLSYAGLVDILGQAEANNRRDNLRAFLATDGRRVVQTLEGDAPDVDRLMARILSDSRHSAVRVVAEHPIDALSLTEPLTVGEYGDCMASDLVGGGVVDVLQPLEDDLRQRAA